jgi:hypothetical protein
MTYDPNVPNANQSPGLFPPQNNNNFTRLQQIISGDHVFNDTAQVTDGKHLQVTLINRLAPTIGDLPTGTNAMLYSFLDTLGFTQLGFFNGNLNFPLTPPERLYPIKVFGSMSVNAGQTITVYPDPGFLWAGTGWAILQNTNTFNFYNIIRSGANDIHQQDSNPAGGGNRPDLLFSGNDLRLKNNAGTTQICVWSLIINRIS